MNKVALLLPIFFWGCVQNSLELETHQQIKVYETVESWEKSESGGVIGVSEAGQRFVVTKCIDLKHYQIYQVEFKDGVGVIGDVGVILSRGGEVAVC